MKAIVKREEKPGLVYDDVPEPVPGPDEIKFKVASASICGTDIHYNRWDSIAVSFKEKFNMRLPIVIGHECAGEVVEVGKNVKSIKVGDRVSLETHIPCGHCYLCQTGRAHNCVDMGIYGCSTQGCFGDYATAPECVAFRLPEGVSMEEGSMFEPAGVAMRAIEEAKIIPGDVVLVYGCGPIGLMTQQLAMAGGASRVIGIDIDDYRLEMAAKYGTVAINAKKQNVLEEVAALASARCGVDVVIELTGSAKVYEHLFKLVRPEGRVVTIGHPVSPVTLDITKDINFRGIELKGVFGRRIWDTWWDLSAMVAGKKLNILDVVTHRFHFSQFEEAFAQIDKGAGKILFAATK